MKSSSKLRTPYTPTILRHACIPLKERSKLNKERGEGTYPR